MKKPARGGQRPIAQPGDNSKGVRHAARIPREEDGCVAGGGRRRTVRPRVGAGREQGRRKSAGGNAGCRRRRSGKGFGSPRPRAPTIRSVGGWLSSGGGWGVVLRARTGPALAFMQALRHHPAGCRRNWLRRRRSHPRRSGYEPDALLSELLRRKDAGYAIRRHVARVEPDARSDLRQSVVKASLMPLRARQAQAVPPRW